MDPQNLPPNDNQFNQADPSQSMVTQPDPLAPTAQPGPTVFSPSQSPPPAVLPNQPIEQPYGQDVMGQSQPGGSYPSSGGSAKKAVVLIVIVLVLIAAGVTAWWLFAKPHKKLSVTNISGNTHTTTTTTTSNSHSTGTGSQSVSFDSIVDQFLSAMQNNNKTVADSLESPAYQASLKQQNQPPTTSFYSMCEGYGQLCTAYFSQNYIKTSTKSTGTYTTSNGTKGEKIIYTASSSSTNSDGGQGQSSNVLEFDGVPNGNSWLIDNIYFGSSVSATQN